MAFANFSASTRSYCELNVNSVKCMATNFESLLLSKLDEFKLRVRICQPDIIFGTETWLNNDISDSFINIPGFKILRKDTTEVRGGVILYVNENIDVEACDQLNNMNVKDSLWVWKKNKHGHDDLLSVIYRKGNTCDELNDLLLEQFETTTKICRGKILINGDFNLPNIDWVNSFVYEGENSFSQRFYDLLCDLYLTQHVLEPTRQRGINVPSCLDLVISSNCVSNVEVCCPIGKADHSVLVWDFHTRSFRTSDRDILRYDYEKADYGKLCRILKDTDWSYVINAGDVNAGWEYLQSKLNDAVKVSVPLIKITNAGKVNPPWVNMQVRRSLKNKFYAWRRYQES